MKTRKNGSTKKEWADTKDYEFHPLSNRFPLMEGEEFENLADDVNVNGQKETAKLYEGKILDGRNRYRACKARKIPCRFENWNGPGDPWVYVLSMNLHRRHLTAESRQAIVIELRKEGKSIRQIAETLQTGVGTVHRDIEQATVPNGTVGEEELPSTVKGKDGKRRHARQPKPKNQPKQSGKAKPAEQVEPAKGERPTISELIQVMYRGLHTAKEVESLEPSKNTIYFRVNGYRVQVTCKIVAGENHKDRRPTAATPPPADGPSGPQDTSPKPKKRVGRPLKKSAKGIITIKGLKSQYGEYAVPVLQDHLEECPRKKKGQMRTYKIIKPLPIESEFQELQRKVFTSTVTDLVGSAFGDLEDLASEVGDIFDNMNEGLRSTNRGTMFEDARGSLESLSQPDVPETLASKEVYYLPVVNASSRAARRDDAVGRLRAVVDALSAEIDNEEVKELGDELENAISEAEGVEFPGMYG